MRIWKGNPMPPFEKSSLTRRATFGALASAPAIIASAPRVLAQTAPAPSVALTPACVLTPAATPGPFYFDPKLQRADGYYSGYPGQGDRRNVDTSGGTFMRGTQLADARGEATFRSVYPGWYAGRTVHVHFKIFIDDKDMLTGQMYFPDALSQYIFANVGAYSRKIPRTTFNGDDELALSDTTRGGFCDIREQADHYLATLVVGVSRTVKTALDNSPTPPVQPRAIVPGVAAAKQRNG